MSQRANKWPSSKETKYNPANWVYDEQETISSEPMEWDIPSDVADHDGMRVFRQNTKAPPRHALADWSGNFAPPPVEWEARVPFTEAKLADTVEHWRNRVAEDTSGSSAGRFQTPQRTLLDLDDGQKYEICPSEWFIREVESEPIATWWNNQVRDLRAGDPDALFNGGNEIDPFWERYMGPEKERLLPIKVAQTQLDPEDTVSRQKNLQTAIRSVENAVHREKQRKDRLRTAKKEHGRRKYEQTHGSGLVTEHTPTVNMYIRPVAKRDIAQVLEIVNHNIETTVDVPELRRLTPNIMDERRRDIEEANLPFLVAVDRSNKGRRRHPMNAAETHHEHILGIAFADDYSDRDSMFRYTVEIECYVRPDYMRNKIGAALLDKLLSMLDPHYIAFGGYDYVGCEPGKQRVVKCVLAHLHVPSRGSTKLAWCGAWLEKFGFEKKGEFKGAGRKLKHEVDMHLFWRTTGSYVPEDAP